MWTKGLIAKDRGPLSCLVRLQDGKCIRRYVDHLHKCYDRVEPSTCMSDRSSIDDTSPLGVPESSISSAQKITPPNNHIPPPPAVVVNGSSPTVPRRSGCNRRPPDYYGGKM